MWSDNIRFDMNNFIDTITSMRLISRSAQPAAFIFSTLVCLFIGLLMCAHMLHVSFQSFPLCQQQAWGNGGFQTCTELLSHCTQSKWTQRLAWWSQVEEEVPPKLASKMLWWVLLQEHDPSVCSVIFKNPFRGFKYWSSTQCNHGHILVLQVCNIKETWPVISLLLRHCWHQGEYCYTGDLKTLLKSWRNLYN